jgi:hypothetical protein
MKHTSRVWRKLASLNVIMWGMGIAALLFLRIGLRAGLALMWGSFALFAVASVSAQSRIQPPTVGAIRAALDEARFEDAGRLAQSLLAEPGTSARDRNDTLELVAIVQIAQRNGERASETLNLLFERDAEHPQRVHDPGPAVDAAISRARRLGRVPATVTMHASPRRDAYGRALLDVELVVGADLVDTLHVFVRAERDPHFTELVHRVSVIEPATLLLPAAALGAANYKWFVEARAPSGLVLARVADRNAPLETTLRAPAAAATCEPVRRVEPLRERWWLWTSVGAAIAGIAVGSAIAAQ